jgi:dipeptidyl aminopeptidase/acylaminoacyl peptidase
MIWLRGVPENVTEGMLGYDKYPAFSPDGKYMAWQSMETPGFEADKERLMLMELETGEVSYLTEEFDQNVSHLVWSEDSRKIWFITGHHATYQIAAIDIETREIATVTEGVHDYTSFDLAGGVMTGSKMSMRMATELFRVDMVTGEELQISFVNKHIYDHIEMAEVRSRWVPTTDGKEMLVWEILPPGFDEGSRIPCSALLSGRSAERRESVLLLPLELPDDGGRRVCDRRAQQAGTADIRTGVERPDLG